ncbi:hypothetical protein [Chryseomicrobium excrementi]|nr:hypothetical protein [Chryseomicrobium excrementi]
MRPVFAGISGVRNSITQDVEQARPEAPLKPGAPCEAFFAS